MRLIQIYVSDQSIIYYFLLIFFIKGPSKNVNIFTNVQTVL